jgi:hypothetical protein
VAGVNLDLGELKNNYKYQRDYKGMIPRLTLFGEGGRWSSGRKNIKKNKKNNGGLSFWGRIDLI